ncbi:MAG: DUF1573 domain-containing protein [bacterium]|nr:DUF1573 domain-containing protein [bacterium]
MIKKISLFILILANFQIAALAQSKKKNTPAKTPAIKVEDKNNVISQGLGILQFIYTNYNFGNINEKGGLVYHDFKFINVGKEPIRITDVTTTCGCTQSNWTRKYVNPGDTGTVRATFDPNGRQGKLDKSLTVFSDGSPNSQFITIKGHVYASKFNFSDTYKYQYGNLAIKTNSLSFPAVKNTSYDSVDIGFFNLSNKKIFIYKVDAPNNVMITQPYDNIPPNTDMKIKVRYYPRQPLEYGPTKQEIKIYTNDDSLPTKIFYINANIVEDFNVMDKNQLKKSPKMVLNSSEIDLGNVPLFNTPTAKFTITNKGKTDLIIRRVIRSCNCLNPSFTQMVVPKGKTVELNVLYTLTNMAGPDTKTLKLITNDPHNSELTLTVKINVTE